MELSILLAEQISVMGVMVLFGFFAGKKGLITLEDSSALSKLVLYMVCPCVAFSALQTEFTREKALGLLLAVVTAFAIHMIFLLLDIPFKRIFHLNNVERASIIYTNCGNLIIPIIGYVLGPDYVIYSCAYIIVQTILIWTHCLSLIKEQRQMDTKKVLFNPNIIAMCLGILLFTLHIRLPEIPRSAIQRVGDCIGPVSMIIIGIMLGSADLKQVFSNGRSWLVSCIRLTICPMVIIAVMGLSHASRISAEAGQIMFITFLASAAPSASTVSQMANIAHKNEIQAGGINMMSVSLCIVTMPLMTLLFQIFCG